MDFYGWGKSLGTARLSVPVTDDQAEPKGGPGGDINHRGFTICS